MIKVDLKTMLTHLKECMLPKSEGLQETLLVTIDFSIDNYDKDINDRFFVDVFFHNPYNYVKVGCNIRDFDEPLKIQDNFEIQYLSDHDSCWREFVSTMCRRYIHPRIKPLGLNLYEDDIYLSFGLLGKTKQIPYKMSYKSRENNPIFKLEKLSDE